MQIRPSVYALLLHITVSSRWCILHVRIAIGWSLIYFSLCLFLCLFRVNKVPGVGSRFVEVVVVYNHRVEQLIRLGLVNSFVCGGFDKYVAG